MKKPHLSKEEILHLAKLANISLTDGEISVYSRQLNDIIEFVRQLDEVDTSAVKSTSHTIETKNIMFEDGIASDRLIKNFEYLKTVKTSEDHYFKVDRIM